MDGPPRGSKANAFVNGSSFFFPPSATVLFTLLDSLAPIVV